MKTTVVAGEITNYFVYWHKNTAIPGMRLFMF
jgi:hypothetical protein